VPKKKGGATEQISGGGGGAGQKNYLFLGAQKKRGGSRGCRHTQHAFCGGGGFNKERWINKRGEEMHSS